MKKILLLLILFANSLSFSMQDNSSKRKANESLERDSKRQKPDQRSPFETSQNVKCGLPILEDGVECGKGFESEEHVIYHGRYDQHISREKKCPGCNKKFRKFKDLTNHLQDCPQDNEGKAKDLLKKINDYQGPEKCESCGDIFETVRYLNKRHASSCPGKTAGGSSASYQQQEIIVEPELANIDDVVADDDGRAQRPMSESELKAAADEKALMDFLRGSPVLGNGDAATQPVVSVERNNPDSDNGGAAALSNPHANEDMQMEEDLQDSSNKKFPKCTRLYLEDDLPCGKEFDNNSSYYNHKYQQHIVREKKCPGCNNVFRRMQSLMNHLQQGCPQDTEGKAKDLLQKIEQYEGPEKCKFCNMVYSDFTYPTVASHAYMCKKAPRQETAERIAGKNASAALSALYNSDMQAPERPMSAAEELVAAAQPVASVERNNPDLDNGGAAAQSTPLADEDLQVGQQLQDSSKSIRFPKCTRLFLEDEMPCGKEFDKQWSYYYHKYQQHIVREKKCPGCNTTFHLMQSLIAHMKAGCPQDMQDKAQELLQKIEKYIGPEKCKGCHMLFSDFTKQTIANHARVCRKNVQHAEGSSLNSDGQAQERPMSAAEALVAAQSVASVERRNTDFDNGGAAAAGSQLQQDSTVQTDTMPSANFANVLGAPISRFSFDNPSPEEMDYYFTATQPLIVDKFVSAALENDMLMVKAIRPLLIMGVNQKSSSGMTPLEAAQMIGLTQYLETTKTQLCGWQEYVNATQQLVIDKLVHAINNGEIQTIQKLLIIVKDFNKGSLQYNLIVDMAQKHNPEMLAYIK